MKTIDIKDEASYNEAMQRIEELENIVSDKTPKTSSEYIELDQLLDAVDKYEDEAYPIAKPSFIEVLKLRMYEMGLNKKQLSQMLGISVSSLSKYLLGTREPSLSVARKMCNNLHISSDIMLGV